MEDFTTRHTDGHITARTSGHIIEIGRNGSIRIVGRRGGVKSSGNRAREREADMPDLERIRELGDRLRARGLRAEFGSFPSGAAMLDVFHDGRLFVLAWSPSQGFAVDDDAESHGLGTSFRHGCPDFEAAERRLVSLLRIDVGQMEAA